MSAGYGTEEAVLIGGGGASAAKKKSSVTGAYVPYAITLIAGISIGLIAVHVSGTAGSQKMGTFFNRDTILDRFSADQNVQPGQVGEGKSEEGEGGGGGVCGEGGGGGGGGGECGVGCWGGARFV